MFASDIWKSPTHGDIVLFASVAMVVAALINIISIKAVSAVNNIGVFFERAGFLQIRQLRASLLAFTVAIELREQHHRYTEFGR